MTNANMTEQLLHVSLVEDVGYQAVSLPQIEFLVLFCDDACSILSTMLKNGKAVIESLIHVRTKSSNDADDAAHVSPLVADSRAAFVFLPPQIA